MARDAATDQTCKPFAAAAKGDAAMARAGTAVPRVSGGEHDVAHALPLIAGAGRPGGDRQPRRRGVFVQKAAIDRPSAGEHPRHYEPTPTELRVLLSIVDVGGAPEVVDASALESAR